jgi:hypothetical protein
MFKTTKIVFSAFPLRGLCMATSVHAFHVLGPGVFPALMLLYARGI